MTSDQASDLLELAPAFALGALDADVEVRFRAALDTSPELADEVAQYRAVVAQLAHGPSPHMPPPDLKSRLFQRIRSESPARALGEAPLGAFDFDAIDWTDVEGTSGFAVHWLRRDTETGEMAVLLRGSPGATYPDHTHPGGEQFFILHGSFADQRAEYKAGDYYRYAPGSEHRDLRVTGDGPCVLLVIAGPGGIAAMEHGTARSA